MENTFHIKLDYMESMTAKKSILAAEINLLRAIQAMNRYKNTRLAELSVKGRLYSKLKEARSTVKSLQSIFPEQKLPRILKRTHSHSDEHQPASSSSSKPQRSSESIESQLGEIQRRLDALSRG